MNSEQYEQYTETLTRNLAASPLVLGLIACGSMAAQDHLPDEWSDHDFWVVVEAGTQEALRTDLSWLPDTDQIALAFRETEHGLKVVYRSGHLVEFAVFDLEELSTARLNSYRVLLDRERIAARAAEITGTTRQWAAESAESDERLFGQFITNLLVGVGRHCRGEKISAHAFVKMYALRHLLLLLARHEAASRPDLLDNLDPLRRFERVFPDLGAELNRLLLLETPQAAGGMLALADSLLKDRLLNYPTEAVDVVTRYIEAAR